MWAIFCLSRSMGERKQLPHSPMTSNNLLAGDGSLTERGGEFPAVADELTDQREQAAGAAG